MVINPEMKQIVAEISACENYFDKEKATLLINDKKWSFDDLQLLSRALSHNHDKIIKKIERAETERTLNSRDNYRRDSP